jgi:hypothetical protein
VKEFRVVLGGKSRVLRYTSNDGRELFRRFKKPLGDLIFHEIMGLDADFKNASTGNPEVQFITLLLGLQHDLPKLDEATLAKWIDAVLQEGESIAAVYGEAGKAALYSGVITGRQLDFEEEVKRLLKKQADELAGETPPGNVQEPATETVAETANS